MNDQNYIPINFLLKKGILWMIAFSTQLSACKNDNQLSIRSMADLKVSVNKTSANWQLFISDYWIVESHNISSTLHQPEKYANNPLIRADVP